jgi:nucleoid-associated protein YgaU
MGHFLEKVFQWFRGLEAHDDDCFSVTVKKGDSLWTIADAITGDGERWHELADANPDKQFSADYVVQPGDVLHVPHSWVGGHAA